METRQSSRTLPTVRSVITVATVFILVVAVKMLSSTPILAQGEQSAAGRSQAEQLSFPRKITDEHGTVVVHTPPIDSWPDFASIEARVAVEVTPAGEDEPVFGVAEFKEWYLRDDDRWLKNKNLSGEWKFDNYLPSHFKKLPDDGNWIDVKAAIPPEKRDEDEPTVFVSDRPAELIVTDGLPQHRTIGASGLEYIADTVPGADCRVVPTTAAGPGVRSTQVDTMSSIEATMRVPAATRITTTVN